MIIQTGKAVLLIRFNDYKNIDFVTEHNKVVAREGAVWMLKAGRRIVEEKLSRVKIESSTIILKAPKSSGGLYYYAKIFDSFYGMKNDSNSFPEYYQALVRDEKLWHIESLYGSWIKLGKIQLLPKGYEAKFKLLSNGKRMDDVVNSTMSSLLYVECIEDIIL